jgi:hypothetical protein
MGGRRDKEADVDNRRPELTKRQKEIARQKKHQEKIDRRNQRHRQRGVHGGVHEGSMAGGAVGGGLVGEEDDPDIAGIVPGPQPPLEE